MQDLLIYTVMFIAGYAGFIKALFSMMQEGAMWDVISGGRWSKFKNKLYNGKPYQQMIENILGGCEQCCSFWFAYLWLAVYFTFCKVQGIWHLGITASIIWSLVFTFICSYVGLQTLIYKKDGV